MSDIARVLHQDKMKVLSSFTRGLSRYGSVMRNGNDLNWSVWFVEFPQDISDSDIQQNLIGLNMFGRVFPTESRVKYKIENLALPTPSSVVYAEDLEPSDLDEA
jgi:hypothetical protein